METETSNYVTTRMKLKYSELRDGESFSRDGDEVLYIRVNRFEAISTDRYHDRIKFIHKDGMVEVTRMSNARTI